MTTYVVTGGTGFIGRFLIDCLLQREGQIQVLVREGSTEKLEGLIERWGPEARDRIVPLVGELNQRRLGVSDQQVSKLKGQADHFFHLAAMYDMTVDDERNRRLNVEGTRNAVALANAIEAGCLHHVSSSAAAGLYRGLFREDMFDEGQKLDHPYHRTKFEAEKIARTQSRVPWRVYRPAIVVGHSETGEMDKIDGPYYFFKAIQRARPAAAVAAADRPRAGLDEYRARRLRRPSARSHRARAGPRREGLSPHRPQGRPLRAGAERIRPRRTRPPAGGAHRQAPDRRPAQGRAVDGNEAAPAQAPAHTGARRHRHPRGGHRIRRADLPVRHPRHRARAGRYRDLGPASG